DDGQILERADLEPALAGDGRNMRAAGPTRAAVHGHRAGAAYPHPAGKAVRKRGIEMALNERDDVEHGLVRAQRHLVGFVAALPGATPERNGKLGVHLRHRSFACIERTATSASARKKPAPHWHFRPHSLTS